MLIELGLDVEGGGLFSIAAFAVAMARGWANIFANAWAKDMLKTCPTACTSPISELGIIGLKVSNLGCMWGSDSHENSGGKVLSEYMKFESRASSARECLFFVLAE